MADKAYFLLYQNNFPVKGITRSIICDLHKQSYYFITNQFYEILLYLQKNNIQKTLGKYIDLSEKHLKQKLDELIDLELGHYTSSPGSFPEISSTYFTPYEIQDSIIELSQVIIDNADQIFESLNILGCQTLELRGYNDFSLKQLTQILSKVSDTRIRNVEVFLRENQETTINNLKELAGKFQIISALNIHSCKIDNYSNHPSSITFTKKEISSDKCCGFISTESFTINLPFFLEGRKNNSCLNRKISIDQHGNIKNCPSLSKSFGNIIKNKLEDVLLKEGFKEYWGINKEKINICKDCEFRYICSDCRAFLENPNDAYSKPLKCGYDPYKGIWEEWSTNSIKKYAIKYYER